MYPITSSYIAIQPGLIRMTRKLSYSKTGKLGSPYLKMGLLLHSNSYENYSTSLVFSTTFCIQIQLLTSRFILI
ncbi:hypothetical protein Bca4012_006025 [Brassica carinata]